MSELLDIINEQGEVIGVADRDKIHREGLLHREIAVWLVTAEGGIVFQHRAPTKQANPDKLSAACAGHVASGMGWLDTAVKELKEETGLEVAAADLKYIGQQRSDVQDPVTHARNNILRRDYMYRLSRPVSELVVEPGEAVGFEVWTIDQLKQADAATKARFSSQMFTPVRMELLEKVAAL